MNLLVDQFWCLTIFIAWQAIAKPPTGKLLSYQPLFWKYLTPMYKYPLFLFTCHAFMMIKHTLKTCLTLIICNFYLIKVYKEMVICNFLLKDFLCDFHALIPISFYKTKFSKLDFMSSKDTPIWGVGILF